MGLRIVHTKKEKKFGLKNEVHLLPHSSFSALKHFLDSRFPHDFDWDRFHEIHQVEVGQGCNEDQFDQT